MSTPTAPSAAPSPSAGSAPSSNAAPSPSAAPAPVSSSTAPTSSGSSAPTSQPTGGSPADIAKNAVDQATGSNQTNTQQAAIAEQIRKEEIRKHKLKVNGREVELDEPEVIRRAQLAEGADAKFREASQMRKETEEFINALINDPLSVLTHPDMQAKINFREIAEQFLAGELQKEMLSPEQRELMELRKFKGEQETARQQAERQRAEHAKQQHLQQLQQRAAAEYDTKITEVLAGANLPKTPYTVKRVAELMHSALSKGYDLDAATAVDMVRQGYGTDLQALVGNLEGDHLVKFLGEDVLKRLRKHDLASLRKQLQPDSAPAQQAPQASAPREPRNTQQANPEKVRTDQWLENLRKKAGL